MIAKLRLQNFRGFEDHELELRPLTILVGANNAGKSTIVEALRLVSVVASRFRNLQYQNPPRWVEDYVSDRVVQPSLAGLGIQFKHLFHSYGEPPAIITATFANKSEITLYLGEDQECCASISVSSKERIRTQARAKTAEIPQVEIMPQVGPVRAEEEVLNVDYVRKTASSNLLSLHFRNQLKVFKEQMPAFCQAVQNTWAGVKVHELIVPTAFEKQLLHLQVRNEEFVGEVGSMGHGLQMWMQTIWFLCRAANAETVILDEPDVYMHADLQRRLIRYVKGKFPQVIVATHSVEIMSEVDSDSILVVDRRQKKSRFATSAPAVQSVISRIGSAHNLHLARLWNTRRLILVEGKDIKILKSIQNKLFPNSSCPIDAIPNMALGGWGGWDYAIGSDMLMKNAVGQDIRTYCIFDRDYHTPTTLQKRRKQAEEKGVCLTIWRMKEIENYFLMPTVVARLIAKKSLKAESVTARQIEDIITRMAEDAHDSIFDAFSTEFLAENRSEGASKANQRARALIKEERDRTGSLLALVSGKNLLATLSDWSQTKYGVSIPLFAVLNEMQPSEVPEDVANLIRAIENSHPFVL
ncbi:MAG TPA: AAA family ATPase [Prosthecobacter sp.]|nr:AAA family ATPase [Prosthecobacter sp.]